jgi:hypothetical protein
MKTFVLFLFISVSAFSQTKKEMRTEIDLLKSQQAQVNLAHQIQVDQLIKKVDSLKTEIVRQNKQSQNDRDTIVYLQGELDNSNDSLTQLNKLLAKIQPKKKEEKTKVTTPRTSETDKPFVNPFGSGGSGNGSGMNYGTNGSGSGPGAGTGLRTRLNNVSINHIETEQDATIYLKLTIDANGNVISCISTSKTTTTNQSLITQVKNAVKSQVKYSKDPGSSPVQVFYTVKINGYN